MTEVEIESAVWGATMVLTQATAEVAAVNAALKEALAVLAEVEWEGAYWIDLYEDPQPLHACPWCSGLMPPVDVHPDERLGTFIGHTADCLLAKVLGR